jgi:hypothetical protein
MFLNVPAYDVYPVKATILPGSGNGAVDSLASGTLKVLIIG